MSSKPNKSQLEIAKRAAAEAAIEAHVKEGMLIGLGTGSTANFLIEGLIARVKKGLCIKTVSSSIRSSEMAKAGGIPVLDINESPLADITIDGADEIDPHLNLIKGGGGALLREKLVALHSKKMCVIADESKLVSALGKFPLPIEIVPFAYKKTCALLQQMGYPGSIRIKEEKIYITDNNNYIYDIQMSTLIKSPIESHQELIRVPGVIETGLFTEIASIAYIGYYDGSFKTLTPT